MATEAEILFRNLGSLTDDYILDMSGQVDRLTDILLSRMGSRRLSSVDLMWWATAISIVLEEPIRRFSQVIESREEALSNFGAVSDTNHEFRARQLLSTRIGEAAASINAKTMESVAAGLRGSDLANAIRGIVDKELVALFRSTDSIFSMYDRIVMRAAGQDQDVEFWTYDGPADNRNRRFCADIVRRNSVFTAEGIEKLNAHPDLHSYVPPNVSILCGGFGCRHLWMPVFDEDIIEGMDIEN